MISSIAVESGVLEMYGSLLAERDDWRGTLSLCLGTVTLFAGAPTAVSIAGGTSLVIAATEPQLKASQRDGGLDFVVNSLDEAVRTLKNCIRQRRALGVGLTAEPDGVFAEMFERGLLPDYTIVDDGLTPNAVHAVRKLGECGSRLLDLSKLVDIKPSSIAWLTQRGWAEVRAGCGEGPELRAWNKRLRAVIPENDEQRRRWLRLMPLYFRGARNGVRVVWLSESETRALESI